MLRAEDVTVRFGGVVAVDGVSLEVGPGESLGLVGPNGSGKSTLLNALTGVVPAMGRASIDDRPLAFGRPQQARRLGVSRTFQTPQLFGELSCLENVLLADADRGSTGLVGAWLARPRMWRAERARWARAAAALELVGQARLAEVPASALAYGEQRLVELARALVGDPRIILLDEPSAGLNAAETAALGALLGTVRDRGIALLLVDHKVDFIQSVCSRLVVLELGRVIAAGAPDDVWRDPAVVDAYLGTSRC